MRDKKVIQIEDYRREKENEEYYEFESFEADSYYYYKQDWKGLVKLRERAAKNNPNDGTYQWRLGEAYVLNGEYEKAIVFLSKLHRENPDDINVQHSILDALFELGKTETEFDWIEKPDVTRLSKDILDICYEFLKNKRKARSVSDIYYGPVIGKGYLKFEEEELLEAIKKDERFEIISDSSYLDEISIKVARKKKK